MGSRLKLWTLSGWVMFTVLVSSQAREVNFWPAFVQQSDSEVGRHEHSGSMGPFFSVTEKSSTKILSIRPLWTSFENRKTGTSSFHILYPLINWLDHGDVQFGHAFNLLQYRKNGQTDETFFQAFPFVFMNHSPEPEASYFAVWPAGGVLKNRLFRDRITFAAWPLFVRTLKGDETRTHVPYPFVQFLSGPRSKGFGLWPLYGHFEREKDYAHTWALWPFFYNYRDDLDKDVPYVRFGILPFYHRETAAGLKSETWAWPFFGYTRETEPRVLYSENRYFWPMLVQGRGDERHVNRWMPFYTHETKPGKEKKWYMWPLLKKETFTQPGLVRDRTSFLYFLYRDEKQRFSGKMAQLTTVWPFATYWNDGSGSKQLQMLDPLTVFFPSNQKIKENWSPLFALYRFDERAGNRRHSLLWDLIVWEKDEAGLQAVFAGPIFEWVKNDHWDFLKGLVGASSDSTPEKRHFFWRKREGE